MKLKLALIAVTGLCLAGSVVAADKHVKPYVKKNGTHVQGHMKTEANRTRIDNYSSKPNVNPYTGAKGSKDPYKYPRH